MLRQSNYFFCRELAALKITSFKVLEGGIMSEKSKVFLTSHVREFLFSLFKIRPVFRLATFPLTVTYEYYLLTNTPIFLV